ncbi:MAG TPA: type II toxin-antitoxin system Phd/YefM family antitoxin [Nitrospiria bacterium]|nr:type II toxin-antitoxin system Phd/YefM family antitoxin [Nitrospiria bacterium]
MHKTYSLAEAKKHLSSLVREADEKYRRVVITRSGVEKAVLLSAEEYDGLIETLDVLSNRAERRAIARAKTQVRRGRTVSLEELKKKIGPA